jgi:hypothetical protein
VNDAGGQPRPDFVGLQLRRATRSSLKTLQRIQSSTEAILKQSSIDIEVFRILQLQLELIYAFVNKAKSKTVWTCHTWKKCFPIANLIPFNMGKERNRSESKKPLRPSNPEAVHETIRKNKTRGNH